VKARSDSGELFPSLFYPLYYINKSKGRSIIQNKTAVAIAKRGPYEKQKNRAATVY